MNVLSLSTEERRELYDLAGKARNTVSPNLSDNIMDVVEVRVALRTAKDAGRSPSEWLEFAKWLKENRKKKQE